MEQILRIVKQLMGTAGMVGTIPKPVRLGVTYFAAFVGVMLVFKYANLGKDAKTFLVIALVVLGAVTLAYVAWKKWMEKKQNQQFGGEIAQHSSATPRSVSDPGQRARLDDMRKKFQTGVDAYKSRGKDLYSLPWYVIVGEPGSGKTEAVRHSNVGFPPGMQDEFQGVGGTINMNWWFTNKAVLLDTAGRLMFEEVKPGETSEWKEFLTLLKKNRPTCPINGLFLVIPADSLIKDTAEDIQKKAGKIAQQLDVIQRVLDVRFPVFVAITKCDKVNGFREFFDGLTDPQLQHQMMGWSNPSPLDEPFKPELVKNHLEQVGTRLRRRRLGLMRDPVPENPDGKRTDEVDSLYAFPHSLELLGSRLSTYLGTIFIAGEWSAKPLFLRGIYFSSSMREGSALDAELAEAIGVGVDQLPEGKVWERERAYFLRDLFLEKVFPEKGLVTRATNTKQMLRSQKIALYGFGFLALAAFTVLAWFAMSNLRNSVKDQGDSWNVVSVEGWENKFWKKSLVTRRGDGTFASEIPTNVVHVDNKTMNLGEFHARLRDVSARPLPRNLMVKGLADRYNQSRQKAQRIVFEAGVVRPLIEGARQKMRRDESDPGSAQREPDALAGLIQLEADILSRGTGTNTGQVTPEASRKFIETFQNYIAGHDVPVDTNLVAVMSWTYSSNAAAKGSWPPIWLSGRQGGSNTLAVNTGISAGIDQFVRTATNSVQNSLTDWNKITSLRSATLAYADTEAALFAHAKAGSEAKFAEAERAVELARTNLDAELAKLSSQPLFAGGISLSNAQQRFRANVMSSAGAALGRVRDVNDAALAQNKDVLFKEIKTRLDSVQEALSSRVTKLLASGDAKEFSRLDDTCLADTAFRHRADFYAQAERLRTEKVFEVGSLIGLQGEQLEKFINDRITALRNQAQEYSGPLKAEFIAEMAYQLKRAEKGQTDAFFTTYLTEAKQKLVAGFPLVNDLNHVATAAQFSEAGKQLEFITRDISSLVFNKLGPKDRQDWKAFVAAVVEQQKIAKALFGDEGLPGTCTVIIAGATEANRAKDQWRDTWKDIKLVCEGCTSETPRTQVETDQKIGEAPVHAKMEIKLIKNANDPSSETFSISTGDWGGLLLIHKYKGEIDRGDSQKKTWLVEFPIGAPGATGSMRLKLKFERPLPDLDKWPTR